MFVMSPCCLIAGILYVSVGLVVHEGVGPLKQQKRRIVSIFLGLISAQKGPHIYSRTILFPFYANFTLLQPLTSEGNILFCTPLHLFDSFSWTFCWFLKINQPNSKILFIRECINKPIIYNRTVTGAFTPVVLEIKVLKIGLSTWSPGPNKYMIKILSQYL